MKKSSVSKSLAALRRKLDQLKKEDRELSKLRGDLESSIRKITTGENADVSLLLTAASLREAVVLSQDHCAAWLKLRPLIREIESAPAGGKEAFKLQQDFIAAVRNAEGQSSAIATAKPEIESLFRSFAELRRKLPQKLFKQLICQK